MSAQAIMTALSSIDVTVTIALATLTISFAMSVTGLARIAVSAFNLRHKNHQSNEGRHVC